MADITYPRHTSSVTTFLPGILLTLAIATLAAGAGNIPWIANLGLGALTLAIVVGIVLGNSVYPRFEPQCHSGVIFAKQKLLRLGIILYGFRLTFQQVLDVGISGILIDALTLSSTFMLACWVGRRWLKLDRDTVWLIGAGSSICGAAAVLATEPVIKAAPAKVAVAVATVVLFGTAAIFLYPLIWHEVAQVYPAMSAAQFGVYTGSTMHEVAQVVAAGHAISPEAENTAVIAKMLRVMMLAPFLLFIGMRISRTAPQASGKKTPVTFPWFALLFILVALFNSFNVLPAHWLSYINQADNIILAMAMAALGLTTRFSQLKQAGVRPLLLGLILFIWLIAGGGAINLAVHQLGI